MFVKQLSVFIENREGRLEQVTDVIREENINILSLSMADTTEYGMLRMEIICLTYFTCGIMDVMVGCLRGLGYSIMPMIVSLAGACGIRVLWIFTVFQWDRTLTMLYISYPVSWMITAAVHIICFLIIIRKVPNRDTEDDNGQRIAVQ